MIKETTIYWIFKLLFSATILYSSLPNIVVSQDSIAFINVRLGYPIYIIPFFGFAKTLGVIFILVPGFHRLKEFAYAGLTLSIIGAIYSILLVEGFSSYLLLLLVQSVFGILAYVYYRKKFNVRVE